MTKSKKIYVSAIILLKRGVVTEAEVGLGSDPRQVVRLQVQRMVQHGADGVTDTCHGHITRAATSAKRSDQFSGQTKDSLLTT